MNCKSVKTFSNKPGREIIIDVQCAYLMIEDGKLDALKMGWNEIITLKNVSAKLSEVLNQELEKLEPDVRTRLEAEVIEKGLFDCSK